MTRSTQQINDLIEQQLDRALVHAVSTQAMQPAPAAFKVTVIIPIYNAASAVLACLNSVIRCTDARHRIVLADDASTDKALVQALLELAEQHPHVRYVRRAVNLGFLQNVNLAAAECQDDVVLLNSDTEVCTGWIDRLQRAAYSSPAAAAVSPCSDNASLVTLLAAEFLRRFDNETVQAELAQCAQQHFPELPTLVGFCMYIKRNAIVELGLFDPIFGRGYGEEDDFCQRARAAGWKLLLAPDVYVRHLGAASFGSGEGLKTSQRRNRNVLQQRWPDYESNVRTWWRDLPLRWQAERLRATLSADHRPKILHILHRADRIGGTENFVRSLLMALPNFSHTVLSMDLMPGIWAGSAEREVDGIRWVSFNAGNLRPNHYLAGLSADLSDPIIERQLVRFITGGSYQLLHVHHLAGWNSLLLPSIAAQLGLPVLLSAHCHYFLCPDPQMLQINPSAENAACDKVFADGDAICQRCLIAREEFGLNAPRSETGAYLQARQQFVRRLLQDAALIASPSLYLQKRLAEAYPEALRKIEVIAHGIVLPSQADRDLSLHRADNPVLNMVAFCGDGFEKGFVFLQRLAEACAALPVRFTIFGVDKQAETALDLVNWQTEPAASASVRNRAMAKADLLLIPSQVAETFSLVLSEAHALALPVLASAIGALPERIREGFNGWFLATNAVEIWQQKIAYLAEASGRAELKNMRIAMQPIKARSIELAAAEYAVHYQALRLKEPLRVDYFVEPTRDPNSPLLLQPQPIAARGVFDIAKARATALHAGAPSILAVARNQWAATYYRLTRPLQLLFDAKIIAAPMLWPQQSCGLPTVDDVQSISCEQIWLLNASSPEEIELVKALRNSPKRPKIVYFLDDAFHLRASSPAAQTRWIERIVTAMACCDQIVTSSRALLELVQSWKDCYTSLHTTTLSHLPHLVINELARNPPTRDSQRLRVLWAGAQHHGADLALLANIVEQTYQEFTWVFFGDRPRQLPVFVQYEFQPPVPFEAYIEKLRDLAPDVAVAPLQDTPFNRYKSPLKLLEYAALGVPVLASNVQAYTQSSAMLMRTESDWLAALNQLRSSARRSDASHQLQNWALREHGERVQLANWKNTLAL